MEHTKCHTIIILLLVVLFAVETETCSGNGTSKNSNTPLIRANCLIDFENLQNAEKKYSDVLNKNPLDIEGLNCRGMIRVERDMYKKAIADFTKLIEIAPNAKTYLNRADAWRRLGEIEKSDIDIANSSKVSGTSGGYYVSANLLQSIEKYHDAIIDYERSIEIKPDKINAINDLAWLYATCEEKVFRDGSKALNLAQKVMIKINGPQQYATLAAAYAELGDFENARLFQEKAVVKAQDIYGSEAIQYFHDMLDTFHANEPWREPAFPVLFVKKTTNR